jgi:ribose/xylose/arabinose/galactoside ABC-type transport system permease subunit
VTRQLATGETAPTKGTGRLRFPPALRFSNIGGVYVGIVLIVVFSVWQPATFPTLSTVQQILNDNAVPGLVAMSVIMVLASGIFDLSIGYSLGFASVLTAWLLGNTQIPLPIVILIVLVTGTLGGAINALVVVVFNIDSFIGTLATGSIFLAAIIIVSGNQTLVNGLEKDGFPQIAGWTLGGFSGPVFYFLAVAIGLWIFLEHTARGRETYAAGLGAEAARLNGIPVKRLRAHALILTGILCAAAGVVVTSQVGSGSPSIGPPYLISAYAAAFLGATQLKRGLMNSWGTVIAVLLLGLADTGLSLANVPLWTPDVFTGVVLLLALGIRGQQRGMVGKGIRLLGGRSTGQDSSDGDAPLEKLPVGNAGSNGNLGRAAQAGRDSSPVSE